MEDKAWRKEHRSEIEEELQELLTRSLRRGAHKTKDALVTGAPSRLTYLQV